MTSRTTAYVPEALSLTPTQLDAKAFRHFVSTQGFRYTDPSFVFYRVPGHRERACVSVVFQELVEDVCARAYILDKARVSPKAHPMDIYDALMRAIYRAYPELKGRDTPENVTDYASRTGADAKALLHTPWR